MNIYWNLSGEIFHPYLEFPLIQITTKNHWISPVKIYNSKYDRSLTDIIFSGDYVPSHQSLVSKLQISRSSSMWNPTLKSAFEPKFMYSGASFSHELFAWLSDVLQYWNTLSTKKKMKEEMRERGNRWYKISHCS